MLNCRSNERIRLGTHLKRLLDEAQISHQGLTRDGLLLLLLLLSSSSSSSSLYIPGIVYIRKTAVRHVSSSTTNVYYLKVALFCPQTLWLIYIVRFVVIFYLFSRSEVLLLHL